jgi:hypothetical protein
MSCAGTLQKALSHVHPCASASFMVAGNSASSDILFLFRSRKNKGPSRARPQPASAPALNGVYPPYENEPANAGEPWTDVDIEDLTDSANRGDDIKEIALFLCRREDEVRSKMAALGLVERPRKKHR